MDTSKEYKRFKVLIVIWLTILAVSNLFNAIRSVENRHEIQEVKQTIIQLQPTPIDKSKEFQ